MPYDEAREMPYDEENEMPYDEAIEMPYDEENEMPYDEENEMPYDETLVEAKRINIQLLYDYSFTEAGHDYYNTLASCVCCPRHKHKKPSIMEDGWVETRFNNTSIGDPGMYCSCNCRHIMRFMARAYNQDCCHITTQEEQVRNE